MWGFTDDVARSFGVLEDFRRRMDRVFDDLGHAEAGVGVTGWPRASLEDKGGELVLEAEVPGLTEKDLGLTLTADTLRLSGERQVTVPEGASVQRRERPALRFARTFALPVRVDTEHTVAAVKDGILTITMPKAADARPRQITIKAS
jgi:HSP20 family protein